jgi:hypothetical protein
LCTVSQETEALDEQRSHAVSQTVSGGVEHRHLWRFPYGLLRKHYAALDIRLQTDIGEDEIDLLATFY